MGDPLGTREVGPGLHWIATCNLITREGMVHHSHTSPYLILGEEKTALVDTGPPHHRAGVLKAIEDLLDGRPLDYVVPTHTELPHAGNLGALLAAWPDAAICGEVSDYHLYFPHLADSLVPMTSGERLELGGTTLTMVDAVVRDLPNSTWAYDERSKTLFVSDALGFSHYHEADECTLLSTELTRVPTVEQIGYLSDAALYFTRFVELGVYFEEFDELIAAYPIERMAPAHGAFISNPDELVPAIKEGMGMARKFRRESLNI